MTNSFRVTGGFLTSAPNEPNFERYMVKGSPCIYYYMQSPRFQCIYHYQQLSLELLAILRQVHPMTTK